jgi:hypothetical protein
MSFFQVVALSLPRSRSNLLQMHDTVMTQLNRKFDRCRVCPVGWLVCPSHCCLLLSVPHVGPHGDRRRERQSCLDMKVALPLSARSWGAWCLLLSWHCAPSLLGGFSSSTTEMVQGASTSQLSVCAFCQGPWVVHGCLIRTVAVMLWLEGLYVKQQFCAISFCAIYAVTVRQLNTRESMRLCVSASQSMQGSCVGDVFAWVISLPSSI